VDSIPFHDMVMVDGFIVSISCLPAYLQELVRKERAAGRDVKISTNRGNSFLGIFEYDFLAS
jgi:hypothetical protein